MKGLPQGSEIRREQNQQQRSIASKVAIFLLRPKRKSSHYSRRERPAPVPVTRGDGGGSKGRMLGNWLCEVVSVVEVYIQSNFSKNWVLNTKLFIIRKKIYTLLL